MTSVPHSGAKSVTPGGSVAGGHTAGPWVIRRDIDGLTILGGPNNEAIWCIAGYLPGGTGEMEANARLIAAAPELLEALDRCSAALQRLHTDIEALTADSEGVVGLHHNGDVAPWSELLEGGQYSDWLGDHLWAARNAYHDARAAIAKATAGETRNAEGAL